MDLRTERLILCEQWLDAADLDALAAMHADPIVMRHFPSTLTRGESDAFAGRMALHFDEHGFAPRILQLDGQCIGFAGLFRTSFAPWVELTWRVAAAHQNRGYATEAVLAILEYDARRFAEVVAYTTPANLASRRVMEKLGMEFVREFDHPKLPEGHPLRRHVLYRIEPRR